MKAKSLFTIAIALVFSLNAYSQGLGNAFYLGGFYTPKIKNLPINLTNVTSQFPQTGVLYGYENFFEFKRVFFGIAVTSSFGVTFKTNDVKGAFKLNGTTIDLGYKVIDKTKFISYLTLGVGTCNMNVILRNKLDSAVNLGSMSVPPDSKVTINFRHYVVSPTLRLRFGEKYNWGLNISYIYPFDQSFDAVLVSITYGGIKYLTK